MTTLTVFLVLIIIDAGKSSFLTPLAADVRRHEKEKERRNVLAMSDVSHHI